MSGRRALRHVELCQLNTPTAAQRHPVGQPKDDEVEDEVVLNLPGDVAKASKDEVLDDQNQGQAAEKRLRAKSEYFIVLNRLLSRCRKPMCLRSLDNLGHNLVVRRQMDAKKRHSRGVNTYGIVLAS
mmetsp:Transcript_58570/g.130932  ORF Transcript_58570/g.130932 Transcript_58570/m.130932 type:complete len:127 (-) Transcript_58570:65-445(-)